MACVTALLLHQLMSRFGLVEFARSGNTQNAVSSIPGGSMMSSVHSDYSDEDEGEEDVEMAEATQESNPQQDANDPKFQRYGIGAKLLMQMGFQAGRGLGAKNEGIVNPIQTSLRPKGVGVGAVPEVGTKKGLEGKREISTRKSPNWFDLFEQIELLGVKVPSRYKSIADQNTPEAEELHRILLQSVADLVSAHRMSRSLQEKVSNLEFLLSTDHALLHLMEAIGVLLADYNNSPTLQNCDRTLEKLSQLEGHDGRIFTAVCAEHICRMFLTPALVVSDIDRKLLNRWMRLFEAFSHGHFDDLNLCPWDQVFLNFAVKHTEDLGKDDIMKGFAHAWHSEWKKAVLVNSDLFLECGFKKILHPVLETELGPHTVLQPYPVLFDVILAGRDLKVTQPLQEKLHGYFLDAIAFQRTEFSVWWHSSPGNVLEVVLNNYDLVSTLFRGNAFSQVLQKSFVQYLLTVEVGELTPRQELKLVRLLPILLHTMELAAVEIVLQFTLLNRWAQTLVPGESQSHDMKLELLGWRLLFKRFISVDARLQPICSCYLLIALQAIAHELLPPLPKLGESFSPSASEIVKLISGRALATSDSLPSHRLGASMKDMLADICNKYGALLLPTDNLAPDMNPIMQIQPVTGRHFLCYLSQDVVWVSVESKFTPVGVLELQAIIGDASVN